MRDILQTLEVWAETSHRFALATVTETWGSSPRPIGSAMGIRNDGLVCGSVSGGCVEGAVIEQALAALHDTIPRRLTFGVVDDASLWEVGLSCGGSIAVWVDPDPIGRDPGFWQSLVNHIKSDEPCVVITDLGTGAQTLWTPGGTDPIASAAYERRQSTQVDGVFVQVFRARERLLIVGASHIAIPLVKFAKELGFETILIDPRSQLTKEERFPTPPDRIEAAWPRQAIENIELTDETYAVVLSHDPKIDDPAIAALLRGPVAYIGALGSRATQAKRRRCLATEGFTEAELDRIHGPVGLDIGAKTPEEIALSIMAQIVQVRRARG